MQCYSYDFNSLFGNCGALTPIYEHSILLSDQATHYTTTAVNHDEFEQVVQIPGLIKKYPTHVTHGSL